MTKSSMTTTTTETTTTLPTGHSNKESETPPCATGRVARTLVRPPEIASLTREHRECVEELRRRFAGWRARSLTTQEEENLAQSTIVDDLFFLKFTLTWEDGADRAFEALVTTVRWRLANHDDIMNVIKRGITPYQDVMRSFTTASYAGRLGGMHPVYVIRAGQSRIHDLMNALSPEEVAQHFVMEKEMAAHLADLSSRSTGLLCKLVIVLDLEGAISMKNLDTRFGRALSISSRQSATYHPQLLGKALMLHVPFFLRLALAAFTRFVSEKSGERQAMCAGGRKGDVTKCPFLSSFLPHGKHALPEDMGGDFKSSPSN